MLNQSEVAELMSHYDLKELGKECDMTVTFLRVVMRSKVNLKQDTLDKIVDACARLDDE